MNETSKHLTRAGAAASLLLALPLAAWPQPSPPPPGAAARLRLRATAYYENGDFQEAARLFRESLVLEPSAPGYFNLALALMRASDYTASLEALERAGKLDPGLINVYYLRGIVHRRRLELAEAIACLERVVALDPRCPPCYYNLGISYKLAGRHQDATGAFQSVLRLDPEHASAHYQLITLHRRAGEVDAADRHLEAYERLKDRAGDAERTVEALERSRYSQILSTPATASPRRAPPAPAVRFTEATAAAGFPAPGGGAPAPVELPVSLARAGYSEPAARRLYAAAVGGTLALGDLDGDGDLDLFVSRAATGPGDPASALYGNDGSGHFADLTEAAGAAGAGGGTDVVPGDIDNDGDLDLYVVRPGPNVLLRNRGGLTFEDASREARVDEPQLGRCAVLADHDHDHDLDIIIANDVDLAAPPAAESFRVPDDLPGQFNTLLRNNGDGTFTDLTDASGLLADCSQSRDLVAADLDGDADLDLVVVNHDAPSLFFANARFGEFRPRPAFQPPLANSARAAAEADVDRDGDPDLLVACATALTRYTNDGHGRFQGSALPLPEPLAATGAGRIHVLDADNDGWCDLLVADPAGRHLRLLGGAGAGSFQDLSARAALPGGGWSIADLDTGDTDGDGDVDLVLLDRPGDVVLLENTGTGGRHWLRIELAGRKANRLGYGAVVEVAGPSHYQRQTVRRSPLHFGLGGLERVDVVRVTCPGGAAQNVLDAAADTTLRIEEQVRVSASCAFLWADGGRGYRLVNEILGVGALGVPRAPGIFHQPDSSELTRIEGCQLRARGGIYELRVTEELNEVLYADAFVLRAIDHPGDLEVIPLEMFTVPPFPEDRFFAVGERRPPLAARDGGGNDVLDLVLERDGRFPLFPRTPYDGVAEPHSLALDLGDLSGAERAILFLEGWIYWPDSSTVIAVAQDPRYNIRPLTLEVREAGRWRRVVASAGLPTSKGSVVPLELPRDCLSRRTSVRLATTLCVYFDRIFVATADESSRCRVAALEVASAALHYRGFSAMERDGLGFERFDYGRASPEGPWSPPRGLLTREGDVTPLLLVADDRFAILGPGDELRLRFDARRLPELPLGWRRTFVLLAIGWAKDGDLNTARSGTIEPLPFRGMSGYPYSAGERYPDSPEHRAYLDLWNTRPARSRAPLGLARHRLFLRGE